MPDIAYPFLTVTKGVEASRWMINGSEPEYLSGKTAFLPGWDYATDIVLERHVMLHFRDVSTALGIPVEDLDLTLLIQWGTAGRKKPGIRDSLFRTRIRGETEDPVITVREHIAGRNLSGRLMLESWLLLERPSDRAHPLAPEQQGSRIWHDVLDLRLEGGVHRFPMQTSSFSTLFGSAHPGRNALWYLEYSPEDLDLPFTAAVRLHINTDRSDFLQMVMQQDPVVLQAMMADVMTQLIEPVMQSRDLADRILESDADSSGSHIRLWIQSAFNDMEHAFSLYEKNRGLFQAMVSALACPGDST